MASKSVANRHVFDMRNHNGLRGLMSIYIVIFHCLMFDHYPVDIQGSSLMPIFFLLSGFSLTLGYYDKIITPSMPQSFPLPNANTNLSTIARDEEIPALLSRSTGYHLAASEENSANPDHVNGDNHKPTLSLFDFMHGRLIRVLPIYYVCNLLCLPAFAHGFGAFSPINTSMQIIVTCVTTFIPISTWLGGLFGMPFDGPGWTISTLIGMWLFFPTILKVFYNCSDDALLQNILVLYWIQLFLLIILFVAILILSGGQFWPAFILASMHPLSRLPVFIMGVLSGILFLRYPTPPHNVDTDLDATISTDSIGMSDNRSFTGDTAYEAETSTPGIQLGMISDHINNNTSNNTSNNTNNGIITRSAPEESGMPWFTDGAWYLPVSFLCDCSVDTPYNHNSSTNINVAHSAISGKYTRLTTAKVNSLLKYQLMNLLSVTGLVVIMDVWTRYFGGGGSVLGAVWLQAMHPYAQLSVIVALSRVDAGNWVSRLLRHPICQHLGELSLSIYLAHWMLAYYLLWLVYGRTHISWPTDQTCLLQNQFLNSTDTLSNNTAHNNYHYQRIYLTNNDNNNDNNGMSEEELPRYDEACVNAFWYHMTWPTWSCVVLPVLTVLVAMALHHLVDKPCTKYLGRR